MSIPSLLLAGLFIEVEVRDASGGKMDIEKYKYNQKSSIKEVELPKNAAALKDDQQLHPIVSILPGESVDFPVSILGEVF